MQAIDTSFMPSMSFTGRWSATSAVTDTSTPEAAYDVCGGFLVAFGLPVKNNGPFCALNDMKRGPDGRLYIADNGAGPAFVFSPYCETGHIWELNPADGTSSVSYSNPALDVRS